MSILAERVVGVAMIVAVSATCLTACTPSSAEAHDDVADMHFSADSTLFAPPSPKTYQVHGNVTCDTAQNNDLVAAPDESTAEGLIVVSDGMLSNAEFSATIAPLYDFTFELTEQVLFERQGKMSEMVVGTGTLTTDTAVYPEVKAVFAPNFVNGVATLNVTIDVPDSVIAQAGADSNTLELALTLDQIAQ